MLFSTYLKLEKLLLEGVYKSRRCIIYWAILGGAEVDVRATSGGINWWSCKASGQRVSEGVNNSVALYRVSTASKEKDPGGLELNSILTYFRLVLSEKGT